MTNSFLHGFELISDKQIPPIWHRGMILFFLIDFLHQSGNQISGILDSILEIFFNLVLPVDAVGNLEIILRVDGRIHTLPVLH